MANQLKLWIKKWSMTRMVSLILFRPLSLHSQTKLTLWMFKVLKIILTTICTRIRLPNRHHFSLKMLSTAPVLKSRQTVSIKAAKVLISAFIHHYLRKITLAMAIKVLIRAIAP